jgi:DNA-binding FrmR family transcriptional regulator
MAAADGQMSDTDPIANAARRLTGALDALEAAVERRAEADRDVEALANQVHALGSDRARLASELDDAAARASTLETANREAAERIDQVMATIRGVISTED